MFNKIGGILALAILGALSFSLMNCGSSSSRPAGLLYVLSEEQSNVSSFSLDLGSGSLSLINSNATTCTTLPTTPCGGPLQISLDPTGATAFVLNQGVPNAIVTPDPTNCPLAPSTPCGIQPTIYPYTVNSDGSFSKPSSPATWNDEQDNDIAVAMVRDSAAGLLFVINQGTSPSPANCPHQPIPVSQQNKNGDPNDACPSISVFSTGSTGATLTGNNCPERNGPCPFRLSRIPTSLSAITYTLQGSSSAQTLLFMTSNKDLTGSHNDNELSVYSVDSSGNLTEAPNSPYTTEVNPTVVLAVNTSPAGAPTAGGIFVFVGNSPSAGGDVSAFQLCTQPQQDNGICQQGVSENLLFPVGTPSSVNQDPVAMLVDPTNSFLYVACNGSNQVFAFSIGTTSGGLTAIPGSSSEPTGSQPVALAMHGGLNSSSEFLYSSNNGSSTITGWPVVATTGTLGAAFTTQFTPGAPSGIAGR